MKVYTVNAFAKTKKGGNPAGIVLNSEGLTEKEMKKIAKKVGFSETAFFMKSDKADFKVRFFTPTNEVDLCGHATIASYYLFLKKKLIKPGRYTQETKAGILNLKISKDAVFMEQKKPKFFDIIDKGEISDSLNSENSIFSSLPIQVVSTGLKDILIPIKSKDILLKIKPDFKKVKKISKKYGVIGYHLFTLDTKASAHCRNLAPLYGINEESATGTSNGALSCYLWKYKSKKAYYVFEQGYSMDKPSEILAKLVIQNKIISEVWVGGIGKNIREMEL